jgi:uncharacterized protein (UPF0305 family)
MEDSLGIVPCGQDKKESYGHCFARHLYKSTNWSTVVRSWKIARCLDGDVKRVAASRFFTRSLYGAQTLQDITMIEQMVAERKHLLQLKGGQTSTILERLAENTDLLQAEFRAMAIGLEQDILSHARSATNDERSVHAKKTQARLKFHERMLKDKAYQIAQFRQREATLLTKHRTAEEFRKFRMDRNGKAIRRFKTETVDDKQIQKPTKLYQEFLDHVATLPEILPKSEPPSPFLLAVLRSTASLISPIQCVCTRRSSRFNFG